MDRLRLLLKFNDALFSGLSRIEVNGGHTSFSVLPYPRAHFLTGSRTDEEINFIVVAYGTVLTIPARVSICQGFS